MNKTEITLSFDDEKLAALEFSLKKEHVTVQKKLEQTLAQLYEQTVPAPLREYLDSRAAPAPRPAARPSPRPRSDPPRPARRAAHELPGHHPLAG